MRELTTDRGLAERYIPHLRYDRAEPYSPEGVGYTVYTAQDACQTDAVPLTAVRSRSCRLQIEMKPGETVIEYAFYYDFDIQHLYDLEHVFVKVDREGGITGILGSFHGKFLNNLIEGETQFEDTHVILYVQPGKHAFVPTWEFTARHPNPGIVQRPGRYTAGDVHRAEDVLMPWEELDELIVERITEWKDRIERAAEQP